MTKLRLLALLAVVALVLLPTLALAQGPGLPMRFHGTVSVDGANVADGTVITATINGDEYTATTPSAYGDSTYALEIAPPVGTTYNAGDSITFMIGAQSAAQLGSWEAGDNVELNLIVGVPPVTPGGGGSITSVVVNTLAAGASATADYNSDTGVLTLGIPRGDTGAAGAAGAPGAAGAAGAQGEAGKDAPIVLPIIALVLAVVAVVVAISVMRRKV